MRLHTFPRAALLGAAVILCALTAVRADTSADNPDRIIRNGIGTPSEQHKVSFEGNSDGTDVIKKVSVKPGDLVKAGDILMVEDTEFAEAEEKVFEAAASATGAIDEANFTISAKTQLVDLLAKLSNGNYSGRDMIDARMDRDVAIARRTQAMDLQKQHQLEYQRQQVKIEHMTLRSPIDGIVESVNLFEGEAVDPSSEKQGACFIVSNDPLWIEFHLDARKAGRLALHDPIEAAFPDQPDHWISGEIIFLDPMVEYVGQTRTVRVSIPNARHFPSGLPMIVRLPAKVLDTPGAVGTIQP